MNHNNEYQIHVAALRDGEHLFQYVWDMDFVARLEMELGLSDLKMEIDVTLNKHSNFWELHIQYYGQIVTTCDRCMTDRLPIKIWEEFDVMVKQVEQVPEDGTAEEDPFVVYTPRKEAYYNVYPLLLDLFLLSLPTIRQCDEQDAQTQQYCDMTVLNKIQNLKD